MAKATNQEIVLAARKDFGTYCGFVHKTDMPAYWEGGAVPFRHHDIMIDALTSDVGHTCLVLPRGSGKTSIVQWWVEWMLGQASLTAKENPDWAKNFRVIWLSHTATEAYEVSLAIKNTIEGVENENYKACFPKVKPYNDKWSEPTWRIQGNQTQKSPTFKAGGIDSPPLGSRADIIVFDDIADSENMATILARKKIRATLDITVKPMLVPTGRYIMPCTRWHDDDPVAWSREQGFHEIYMKALTEVPEEESFQDHDVLSSGVRYRSYWPERFTVEWLLDERNKNPRAFARSYQNEVAPEEGLQFERIWFADNRFDYLPEVWLTFDSWDTAHGEGPGRSFSVGTSWAVTTDWHYYLTHVYRAQIPYSDLLDAIEDVSTRSSPLGIEHGVIVEAKSSGLAVIQDRRMRGVNIIRWEPAGQRGAKYTKLQLADAVSVVCSEGRVHLPTDLFVRRQGDNQWIVDFEHEIFSYGGEPPDDQVDSFCQFLTYIEGFRMHNQYVARQPRRVYLAESTSTRPPV